jgi:hypothetical protein
MYKKEFTDRVDLLGGPQCRGWKLDDDDWQKICKVYAWHPMFSGIDPSRGNGKDEIASLFFKGGMGIIDSMVLTAAEMAGLETQININNTKLDDLQINHKKEIDDVLERQRNEIGKIATNTVEASLMMCKIVEAFKIKP